MAPAMDLIVGLGHEIHEIFGWRQAEIRISVGDAVLSILVEWISGCTPQSPGVCWFVGLTQLSLLFLLTFSFLRSLFVLSSSLLFKKEKKQFPLFVVLDLEPEILISPTPPHRDKHIPPSNLDLYTSRTS